MEQRQYMDAEGGQQPILQPLEIFLWNQTTDIAIATSSRYRRACWLEELGENMASYDFSLPGGEAAEPRAGNSSDAKPHE